MKNSRKYIIKTIAIFVLAALLVLLSVYNKKPESIAGKPATFSVEAPALIAAFTQDEALANTKYLGKIIQVKGTIIRIDNHADTLGYITLGDTGTDSYVRCALEKQELKKLKSLSVNSELLIKGYCIGYLMDVEMNRCVIDKIIKP